MPYNAGGDPLAFCLVTLHSDKFFHINFQRLTKIITTAKDNFYSRINHIGEYK